MADKENPLWHGLKAALDQRGPRHVFDWPYGAHVALFWQDDRYLVLGVYNSRPEYDTWWGLQATIVEPILVATNQVVAVRFLFQDQETGGTLITGSELRSMLPHLSVAHPSGSSPAYKVFPKDIPSRAYLCGRAIVDEMIDAVSAVKPDPEFDPVMLLHPERRARWRWVVHWRLQQARECRSAG